MSPDVSTLSTPVGKDPRVSNLVEVCFAVVVHLQLLW